MSDNQVLVGVEHLEYPFVKKGMTVGEFREELRYFSEHRDAYKKGNYKPLWKQKGENNGKR